MKTLSPNTHSIGAGRFNVAVPLWEEEANLLNRVAGQARSRVELVRELILDGARVRFPNVAREIEQIRRQRAATNRRAAKALADERQLHLRLFPAVVCLAVGLMSITAAILGGDDLARRGSSRTARVLVRIAKRVEA